MHLYFAHSYWTSICYPYFDPSILCHAVLSVTFTLHQLQGQYSVTFTLMPVFSVIQGSSLVTRTNTPGRFLRNTWVLWTTRYWPESHFDNSEHSIASVQNSRLDEFLLAQPLNIRLVKFLLERTTFAPTDDAPQAKFSSAVLKSQIILIITSWNHRLYVLIITGWNHRLWMEKIW